MNLEVRWRPRARRDFERLAPPVQRRVLSSVERFALTGEGDVKRLQDVSPPEYRLRIGGWRVRFTLDPEARALYVVRVLSRDKAYR